MKLNILILCTYPISEPKHGGQLRVRNIIERYRSEGHRVDVIGVLGSPNYDREEGFVGFPGIDALSRYISNPFLMEDYAIGKCFIDSIKHREGLAKLVKIQPDLVQVEQPWLFSFASSFIKSNAPKANIIYSSHNIEWRLKKEICSSYMDPKVAQHNSDLVKHVELAAISGADAVVCVSEGDADWIRTQTDRPVVIAPNGVKAWQTSLAGHKEASTISKGLGYALYCASAHPPNMTGFFEMLDGVFGSLKPNEKLIVAGGAGMAIASDVRLDQSSKLAEKVVVAGVVSQPCLEGLLDGANCIILPLTQGGGTNLKTAEAIWSDKHIVATSVAMRGFERFIDVNGVHLADDPGTFKRALRKAMASEPLILSEDDLADRRTVLWDACLDPLMKFVSDLTEKKIV